MPKLFEVVLLRHINGSTSIGGSGMTMADDHHSAAAQIAASALPAHPMADGEVREYLTREWESNSVSVPHSSIPESFFPAPVEVTAEVVSESDGASPALEASGMGQ